MRGVPCQRFYGYEPTSAAYLNLIEPWWKTLRSLALKGRRIQTWEQVCDAVAKATAYWNAHRHPSVWGRRHRPRWSSGIAIPANVRLFGGCTIKVEKRGTEK